MSNQIIAISAATPHGRTARILAEVKPELAEKVRRVLAAMGALGFPMVAYEGLRTVARQQELYAQGRTTPGPIVTHADGVSARSKHQDGAAVDCTFYRIPDGGKWTPVWEGPFDAFGSCAEAVGLEWGGTWRMSDKCHVEL